MQQFDEEPNARFELKFELKEKLQKLATEVAYSLLGGWLERANIATEW